MNVVINCPICLLIEAVWTTCYIMQIQFSLVFHITLYSVWWNTGFKHTVSVMVLGLTITNQTIFGTVLGTAYKGGHCLCGLLKQQVKSVLFI